MKKIVGVSMMVLFCLSFSSVTTAGKFSIGAFGGMNIPIAQGDAKSGALFGAKGRIPLLPFLALEPNFVFAKYAGKNVDAREKSYPGEGGDITSFGADLLIGTMSGMSKMKFYGLTGINTNTYKRKGLSNKTGVGLTLGTGFEFFATEVLSLEIRTRYHAIKIDDGGRPHLEISGGLNYCFGKE
jgi:hypothetical protein